MVSKFPMHGFSKEGASMIHDFTQRHISTPTQIPNCKENKNPVQSINEGWWFKNRFVNHSYKMNNYFIYDFKGSMCKHLYGILILIF